MESFLNAWPYLVATLRRPAQTPQWLKGLMLAFKSHRERNSEKPRGRVSASASPLLSVNNRLLKPENNPGGESQVALRLAIIPDFLETREEVLQLSQSQR